MILGRTLESWCASYPLIRELVALQETTWFNPGVAPVAQALGDVGLSAADVADASARLARFASFLERAFPETAGSGGIIESDIVPLTHLQPLLAERYGQPLNGALWLKRDSSRVRPRAIVDASTVAVVKVFKASVSDTPRYSLTTQKAESVT